MPRGRHDRRKARKTTVRLVVAGAVATAVLATGGAVFASGDAPASLDVCFRDRNGDGVPDRRTVLRATPETRRCRWNETRMELGEYRQGFAGEEGAAGATGPAGAAGPQGPAGENGSDGADGATGPVGPQGPPGADGAVGPAGPQGPAGADGADGAIGPAGPTGPQGPAGADGLDGADGEAGPAGPEGPTGPRGPAGADGADGTFDTSGFHTHTVCLGNGGAVDSILGHGNDASTCGTTGGKNPQPNPSVVMVFQDH